MLEQHPRHRSEKRRRTRLVYSKGSEGRRRKKLWWGAVVSCVLLLPLPTKAQELFPVDTMTSMGSCAGCAALVSEKTLGDPETPLPFVHPMIDVASDGTFRLVDLRPGLHEGAVVLT